MNCHSCNKPMIAKVGRFGPFLSCSGFPDCDTSVAVNRHTGQPIGTPADSETRELRKRAHDIFDKLWTSGLMSRDTAYSNIRKWMGMGKDDAHIGMFNAAACQQLIRICKKWGLKE